MPKFANDFPTWETTTKSQTFLTLFRIFRIFEQLEEIGNKPYPGNYILDPQYYWCFNCFFLQIILFLIFFRKQTTCLKIKMKGCCGNVVQVSMIIVNILWAIRKYRTIRTCSYKVMVMEYRYKVTVFQIRVHWIRIRIPVFCWDTVYRYLTLTKFV